MGIKLAEDAMAVIASWRSRSKSEKLKKKMSGSRSSSEPGRATHEHLSRGWSSISGGRRSPARLQVARSAAASRSPAARVGMSLGFFFWKKELGIFFWKKLVPVPVVVGGHEGRHAPNN
jgi:hypothetical protein